MNLQASPAIDRSRVLELRVHGVSGTPPEQLLDCPLVEQVGGDREARFLPTPFAG